jgi:hypothetical protein
VATSNTADFGRQSTKRLRMEAPILKLRHEAERIASKHRIPDFYLQFKAPLAAARSIYFKHPLVKQVRELVRPRLREHLGHGLYHSMRVSLDSAALIFLEFDSIQVPLPRIERLMLLGELAGLLHDICRGQADHAVAGAREAERLVAGFALAEEERQCICCAIENHEAFTPTVPCRLPWIHLISNCLYDADKFRWGPDNFTHTLWYMMDHQQLTIEQLIERFPWGMTGITRIRETFRSTFGRQYGPEIIDAGMEIGKEIYQYLLKRCGNHNQCLDQ